MSGTVGVIIPSYRRPQALRRAINYWSHSSLPVLIVDGSPVHTNIKCAENIKYEHHPNVSMQVRVLEAAKKFTTDFLILCADDDFFGFSALKVATEFLTNSPNFSAVQGWGITFSYDGRTFSWKVPDYEFEDYEVIDDDPIQRVHSLFHPYRQVLWSVYRRETLVEGWQTVEKVSNLFLHEINQNVIAAIGGNVRTLPIFLNARDRTPGVSLLVSPERRSFAEWIVDPQTETEREWWKKSVTSIAQKHHPQINVLEVDQALDDVLRTCVQIGSTNTKSTEIDLGKIVKRIVARFEPNSFKRKRWAASLALASRADYPIGPNDLNHAGNRDYWLAAQQDWTLIRDVIVNNEPAI